MHGDEVKNTLQLGFEDMQHLKPKGTAFISEKKKWLLSTTALYCTF